MPSESSACDISSSSSSNSSNISSIVEEADCEYDLFCLEDGMATTTKATILPSSTNDVNSITISGSNEDDENHATILGEVENGQWKDGICSCFRLGVWRPHLWFACLFPQILLRQILLRMNLLWQARHLADADLNSSHEGNHSKTTTKPHDPSTTRAKPPRWIAWAFGCVFVAYHLYDALSFFFGFQLDEDDDSSTPVEVEVESPHAYHGEGPSSSNRNHNRNTTRTDDHFTNDDVWWINFLYLGLTLPMSVLELFVVIRLRRSIRKYYKISPRMVHVPNPYHLCQGKISRPLCNVSFGIFEDLVCSIFCNCCVLDQMARQTTDYEGIEPASCCPSNGLRGGIDSSNDSSHNSNSSNNNNNEESSSALQDNDNRSRNPFRWFQRIRQSSHYCEKESTITTAPPSPSPSLEFSGNHLRYRLLSTSTSSDSNSNTSTSS